MTRSFSLYLDLVRVAAALLVFIDHASTKVATGAFLWQLAPLGSDAVVVFFVLSGFVIAHVVHQGETARTYAVNRLARLHSVAIPAIVLTLLADHAGMVLDPTVYETQAGAHAGHVAWRVLNCVLFTNQAWFNDIQPGTNVAYWSLGYEAPYYLAFGLAAFGPRRWGMAAAAMTMLLAGPNIAKLAPMWLLGVGVHAISIRSPVTPRMGLVLWALSMAGMAAMSLPTHQHVYLFTPMAASIGYARDLAHYYMIAAAFALNLLGAHAAAPYFAGMLERAARPIRWAGQRTFAMYLFHQPLIQLADAISPWPNTHWSTRLMILGGIPVAIAGLAQVSESRKGAWRRFYGWLLPARRAPLAP